MTRDEAVKAVNEILKKNHLDLIVRVDMKSYGTHGDAQIVYIEKFPVKGNKKLIEVLKSLPNFRGYKTRTLEPHFMFRGYFEVE